MFLRSWFGQRRSMPNRKQPRRSLQVEALEARYVLASFAVNSLLDTVDANPGDGLAADAQGFASLRAAIMEANAQAGADQIILPAGTYHLTLAGADEDVAAGGDLDITGDLTITGEGAAATVIDAATIPGGDRVLDAIGPIGVHLAGLTITGGNVVGDGGGILNRVGTLSVSDCTIADNTASDPVVFGAGVGGGISNGLQSNPVGGTLQIDASIVSGNHAFSGGGISNNGSATVTASRITGNTSDLDAAGIYVYPPGQLTLIGSTVSDNTASLDPGWGGGILVLGSQATVIESTISGNLAQAGAGINVVAGQLTVVNSTISANGSNHVPGGPATSGGGIEIFNSIVLLDHVTLSHNVANLGAGIVSFSSPGDLGSITIASSIIADNLGPEIQAGTNLNYLGNYALFSLGHNLDSDGTCAFTGVGDLSGVDPLLGPLADNGGTTQTRALLSGSPAIDAGDPLDTMLTDQRGFTRPADGDGNGVAVADIGAYEVSTDVIVITANTSQAFLDSLTHVTGSILLVNVPGRQVLSLPNLVSVTGNFIITGNPDLLTISAPLLSVVDGSVDLSSNPVVTGLDLGSLTSVGGSIDISENTSSTGIDLSTLTSVGGSIDISENTSSTGIDLSALTSVGGDLNVEAAQSITAATADGATSVALVTAQASMAALLPQGTFASAVHFTVEQLDPAALPPEQGQAAGGSAASIAPLFAYQFSLAIPTLNQDASLTFEVDVAALVPAEQASLLAALAAGYATVAVKNDAPGSVYEAFAICDPGEMPVDGCVAITLFDAAHNPLPAGSTAPAFVRFEGITGHFSTFAVVIVTPASNFAPEITSLTTRAASVGRTVPDQPVTLAATFTDPDAGDSHTAVIDWGDGATSAGIVSGQSVSGSHNYRSGGIYTIGVTVTDLAGTSASATTTAYVTGVRLEGGTLQVVGTAGNDRVEITPRGKQAVRVHADFLPEPHHQEFSLAAIDRVYIVLGAGNDRAVIAQSLNLSAIIEGGAGQDELKAAGGPSVLVGGDGNDRLQGGRGRDLLIGGTGADCLHGRGGDDILIAGFTAHDSNAAALLGILAEWNAPRDYLTRIHNLRDGSGTAERLNGSVFLKSRGAEATIVGDDARDVLKSGCHREWFFANLDGGVLDRILGRSRGMFADDPD